MAYDQIASRLSKFNENIYKVRVERDEKRELLILEVIDHDGTVHQASSVSGGTLRFLAMFALELDTRAGGLICLEEPENSIYPDPSALCENKLKIYLILLLDDHSRFIFGFRLLESTSVDVVIEVVAQAVDRYGKMEEILTDRGFVFYSWRGINRFGKFLQIQRIDHTHARPHHPQTLTTIDFISSLVGRSSTKYKF